MDSVTRYFAGCDVLDTSMQSAIATLEAHWISQFWASDAIVFDAAFDNAIFRNFLDKYGIEPRPVPPRRHNKNFLESEHRVIRDIYLRLKAANPEDTESPITIQQALRISNDLYGNHIVSAYGFAKGFTRPVGTGQTPPMIPSDCCQCP